MRLDELTGKPPVISGGDSGTFGFGMQDPTLIFKILREKMYSKPKKAAIQEYLCNARDAHREAGCEDRPVLVTFPDFDGSEILIRDYGLGIPRNKMESVFCQYGVSTKRGTDRFTGGWGLGCKTGFAIGDSFSITSITNDDDGTRWKRSYLAYLDHTEAGSMTVLSEEETEEETGLQIHLPIDSSQIDEYLGYLEITTRHWKVRPIVEGAEVNYKEEKTYVQGHKWGIQEPRGYNQEALIILDGIRYIFKKGSLEGLELNPKQAAFVEKPFILYFDTGELTPTPNREDVTYDTEAKYLIAARLEEIADTFHAQMAERMDKLLLDAGDNPLKIRSSYDGEKEGISNYAPGLAEQFKSRMLPSEIRNNDSGVRVWSFGLRNYDTIPVEVGKEVLSFRIREKMVYIIDDTTTSKPTRQRVFGFYSYCMDNPEEFNPLCVDKNEYGQNRLAHIYLLRFRTEDERASFFKQYPPLLKLLHPKPLSAYASKTLDNGERKKAMTRGGGTEVRLLDREKIQSVGLYQAFVRYTSNGATKQNPVVQPVATYDLDECVKLEKVIGGVYVVLKDSNVYDYDGHQHLQMQPVAKPALHVKKKRRKRYDDYSDDELAPETPGTPTAPTTYTRPVVKFPHSLELHSSELHAIPSTVPIYGVFEAGWKLIRNNPNFITVRDYHHKRAERFRNKYSELIVRGKAFHYPRDQEAFSKLGAGTCESFMKTILAHPRYLCPSPELREWWDFQKKYPDFVRDQRRLFTDHKRTHDSISFEPMQISLSKDNRLIWFASALAYGRMTAGQKTEFLKLLHTNQLKTEQAQ